VGTRSEDACLSAQDLTALQSSSRDVCTAQMNTLLGLIALLPSQLRQQEDAQFAAAAADGAAHAAAEHRAAAANASAAAAAVAKASAERYATASADAAELVAAAASAVLNEDPSAGQSASEPHRCAMLTVLPFMIRETMTSLAAAGVVPIVISGVLGPAIKPPTLHTHGMNDVPVCTE